MEDGRYGGAPPGAPEPGAATESDDVGEGLERFRDRLRYFAARRLRDWAEAEDVAQEALRRALEAMKAGRIAKPAALPAFLFQTALHICQHRSRSVGREARALRRVGATTGDAGHSDTDDPLAALISEERRLSVHRALEQLDEGDRKLLSLTYGEALESAEIGRRLNLSEGNVRVRRHRALRRLAELLGVTGDPERGL
jgi:RNA polymerase sigma-70 factor (ECF subfamily)